MYLTGCYNPAVLIKYVTRVQLWKSCKPRSPREFVNSGKFRGNTRYLKFT